MNEKKLIIPDFYRDFTCTAGECPDTCCKDWDIVVDGETLDFYRSTGDEQILAGITTDSDGDTVLKFENGVCPFLNEDRLCGVQLRYGAEKICETCRAFPRITQDYTEFEERLLTLACPETARLLIINRERFEFITDIRVSGNDSGYDPAFMNFLLRARYLTAGILREDAPFFDKMRRVLAFTENAQQLIDDEIFDIERLDDWREFDVAPKAAGRSIVFKAHRELDVMDKAWLEKAVSCENEKLPVTIDEELTSLALYYLARYYLTAISSYDIITTVKRSYCAAVVCAALIARENAENDSEKRALIYQKYSKEIEHSDENLDYLTDIFLEDEFSSEKLIRISD